MALSYYSKRISESLKKTSASPCASHKNEFCIKNKSPSCMSTGGLNIIL